MHCKIILIQIECKCRKHRIYEIMSNNNGIIIIVKYNVMACATYNIYSLLPKKKAYANQSTIFSKISGDAF